MQSNNNFNFFSLLQRPPHAMASVRGSRDYPYLRGSVYFYQTPYGVIVSAKITGLPDPGGYCKQPIFAFHIHAGGSCTGTDEDPFKDAGSHYNPKDCPHPYHAGDLPPLFGANGYAFSIFLTNRFTVNEIIGKTVIIHSSLDDFTTQPSGNAGVKIACGEIRRTYPYNW